MRYPHFLGTAATLLAGVSAHTWVEQLNNVAADGSYTGAPGYIRSYVDRSNPSFNDNLMTWLSPQNSQPRLSVNDKLCHPNQQNVGQNSKGFPPLSSLPGNTIALRYLENGHTTLPQNQPGKPASGGLVYIYATTNPKPDETVANLLQWGPNGTLDEGRLLNINPFDDGRCYQVNPASPISVQRQAEFPNKQGGTANHELWCQNNVVIPQDAKGTLTMYWLWQWPTQPGIDPGLPTGKDEIYSSCMDINIVANSAALKSAIGGTSLGPFQDNTPPLSDFMQRLQNTTVPQSPIFYGPGSKIGGSAAPSQAPASGSPGQFAPQPQTTMKTSAAPATTAAPHGQQPGVVYVTETSIEYATVTVTDGVDVSGTTATPTAAQGNPGNGNGAQSSNQNGATGNTQTGGGQNGGRNGHPHGNSAKFRR